MNNKLYAIDKPKHLTSNQVIQIIKKELNLKKIGHGGTLDPIATGVLIIGIDKNTKLLNNHLNTNKTYIATIEFGYSTDTYDIEGKIIKTSTNIPTLENIILFCNQLLNEEYYQQVPLYSAVKINGKELYKYARNNETVNTPKKLVKLNKFKIDSYENKKLIITLDVSKGFYIRSFVNDLANFNNSAATLIDLRRIKSGEFSISDSYQIDEFIQYYKKNRT